MTEESSKRSFGNTILLVEDDEDSCVALAELLNSTGYEVTTATTVRDGLRLTRERHFDLIVLDNWFKEGSGIELCKQIRRFNPEIPILFYSAAGYDTDVKEGLNAGAQRYIIKPNFDEFRQALRELLLN